MLRFNIFGITFSVSFAFFAVLTIYLILDRSGTGCLGVLAILCHEVGHGITYCLIGKKPSRISLSIEGMRISLPYFEKSLAKELSALAAGSVTNILMFFFLTATGGNSEFTEAAYIQLFVGAFNLLPVGELDGGMILRKICGRIFEYQRARMIERIVSIVIILPLTGFAAYLSVFHQNFTLLITAAFLFILFLKDRHV